MPRHATRIRNEYKYIEGLARGTEKERHVVQRVKGREDHARIGNVGVTRLSLSPLALVLVPPSSRSLLAGPCRRLPPSNPLSRIGARRVPEYASVSARLQHAPRRRWNEGWDALLKGFNAPPIRRIFSRFLFSV